MTAPAVNERERSLAIEAAQAAIRTLRRASTQVLSAPGRDVKAQADLDAERAILDVLAPSGLPILSEEGGGGEAFTLEADGWIIDPLDGTMNFTRSLPVCCTCIALWRGGPPAFGVISEVCTDVVWAGGLGVPTTCNGVPCAAGNATSPDTAVLATGFPRCFDFGATSQSRYAQRMAAYKKIRMIGCAGLSLAWTAGGRMDLYYEEGIFLWDVAAGLALVEGAGGTWSCSTPDAAWRCDVAAGSPDLVAMEQPPVA